MKNGLFFEDGRPVYYRNNQLFHAGIIEYEGNIYYIGKDGKAIKGEHAVHKSLTNGILQRGTYKFDDNYKLIPGSYIAPQKQRQKRKKSSKKARDIAILVTVGVLFIAIVVIPWMVKVLGSSSEIPTDDLSFEAKNITINNFSFEVSLVSENAKRFYDGEISIEEAAQKGGAYRPLAFRYHISNEENAILYISESENMSFAKEYLLPHNSISIDIDNLKTGTQYYYKVVHEDETLTGSFKTAKSTRFISISGMYNARDIGGHDTLDGKTIKQGYIIRGAEIDGLVEPAHVINNDGVVAAMNEFGFVYDFDLRANDIFLGEYVSRFGNSVRHDFYNAPAYGAIFNSNNKDIIKNIFSSLADKNNYPMYLHCTHGVDRTGTIVFLLQGILNIPENTMISEYYNSAFTKKVYIINKNIDSVIATFNAYEGKTLNEKIENYLINKIGVTKEEIDSIRNILLE